MTWHGMDTVRVLYSFSDGHWALYIVHYPLPPSFFSSTTWNYVHLPTHTSTHLALRPFAACYVLSGSICYSLLSASYLLLSAFYIRLPIDTLWDVLYVT